MNNARLALPSLPLDERGEVFLEVYNRYWSGAEIKEADQGGVLALLKKIGLRAFGIGGD